MSNFNAGQFDDAELERQLQEEFRRRSTLAGQQAFNLASVARREQSPAGYPFNMLGDATSAATSPYYQRTAQAANPHHAAAAGHAHVAAPAHHHQSPYGGATSAYQAVAEAQAQAQQRASYGGTPSLKDQSQVAQLYAAQQRQRLTQQQQAQQQQQQVQQQQQAQQHAQQQQQQAQQASSYSTGAGYSSAGVTPEQRYGAAYHGLPTPATTAYRDSTAGYARSAEEYAMLQQQQQAVQHQQQQQQAVQHQQQQGVMMSSQNGSAYQPTPRTPSSSTRTPSKSSRGSSSKKTPKNSSSKSKKDSNKKTPKTASRSNEPKTITGEDDKQWFTGCVPLGLDDDKYWLSELQVYLRANFAEAFGATEEDIAAPMHGRNKPIALGQVGIRCLHCKQDNPAERGQQATSYPSLIGGIYNSVQQMLRLHLDCCLSMPHDVRMKIEQLRASCSSRGGRKQYWIDSARRLGLVDTPHGIHFGRDPQGPLPPLTGPSVNSKEARKKKAPPPKPTPVVTAKVETPVEKAPPVPEELPPPPPVDTRPLVFPEDKELISDYLYLTLEQMSPCLLMEADRVGCYKTRKVGFHGLACKHCVGQAGCGRYFPASEASLSQTTTSQTIMNHVRNCRRCPMEIRECLEIMKRSRMGPDGKKSDKPKHGGRKVFFHRLWCRIQDVPFEEGKGETKESKRRKMKKPGPKRAKKKSVEGLDGDSVESRNMFSEDTDTEDDSDMSGAEDLPFDDDEANSKPKVKSRASTGSASKKKQLPPWREGCVRLTKGDDEYWLSDMECFARSDLVEVFSLKKSDSLEGYGGRKEPAIGQVGIRCIFCKSLDPAERPNGCVSFPEGLTSIHTKTAEMIRLHFPSCPSTPDDARDTFKSFRGFDAKIANDDSQQYWVDAARDIGLTDIPPHGPRTAGSWGMTFRRDPLQPSPADELDLEASGGSTLFGGKNAMVRLDDQGLCTDQVLLLLDQVRPCCFMKSDRRVGPSASRGRDRVLNFPGLCCQHCNNKNKLGRYFPVSAKNLTDSTANSLQSHIASCSRCPEPIKASLAYLGHRSVLQKAELSGVWKKAFFKKVWERLHVERTWTSADDEVQQDGENEEYSSNGEHHDEEEDAGDETKDDDDDDDGSDSEKEEMGDQMNALIKAAAIWLTEQDSTTDTTKSTSRGGNRGRSLPTGTKRPGFTPSRNRGGAGLPTKRRRVHF